MHYNALTTDNLPNNVAKAYNIIRSKNRGMINIAIICKQDNKPTHALVTGHTVKLNKQMKSLNIREIREKDAIYYIAEFAISHGEHMSFTLNLGPENTAPQTTLFSKQFFVTRSFI